MPTQNNNPFMDAFKMFTENNHMFQNPKMSPMMDMNGMVSMQRRNAEAATAANQAMTENVQAFARFNMKIMQDCFADMTQFVKEVSGAQPEVSMAKGADYMKSSLENAVSNTRELAEMVTKSNMEVIDLIGKRTVESFNEYTSCCAANPGKKKSA